MLDPLTVYDLLLINDLSNRAYSQNTFGSNATELEIVRFHEIKDKMYGIANFFANKYSVNYGPFKVNVSPERNQISIGNNLLDVWSTFFKGAENKQYAAQISFVIDRNKPVLHVGFYFGGASKRGKSDAELNRLKADYNNLGSKLFTAITSNLDYLQAYNTLFDYGFVAMKINELLTPEDWLTLIRTDPEKCQITVKIIPNDSGVIEISTLDFYISLIVFLMGGVDVPNPHLPRNIIPPTPQHSAKKAEKNAMTGLGGEEFVLAYEKEKLLKLEISKKGYPRYVAQESMHFGYDILSLDENEDEILIEVKTTTRLKEDQRSRAFFLTKNEMNTYHQNKSSFIVRRVYDIDGNPSFDDIDMENVSVESPNGYLINY